MDLFFMMCSMLCQAAARIRAIYVFFKYLKYTDTFGFTDVEILGIIAAGHFGAIFLIKVPHC